MAVSDTIGAGAFGIGGTFVHDSTGCILAPHSIRAARLTLLILVSARRDRTSPNCLRTP